MSNPYLTNDGTPHLKHSWLCFVDILGFTEMLKENNIETIQRLHLLLKEGRVTLEGQADDFDQINKPFPKFHALTSFTDNIVLGFPISDDGESESGMVFQRIAEFQLEMAVNGFFFRGGIAVGDAYIDDLAVFGPALIEAYEGESKLARDPRIILTDSAKELVKVHLAYYGHRAWAPQNHHLMRDRDGQWFIDYLETTIIDPSPEAGIVFDEVVLKHKIAVETKLMVFKKAPKIWSKYEWAASYHNAFCEKYPYLFDEKYFVDVDQSKENFGSILDKE